MQQTNPPAHAASRMDVADALSHILGNTCRLAMTTRNFGWNAQGPASLEPRRVFGDQTVEMSTALDAIALRIRALGAPALTNNADDIIVPVTPSQRELTETEQMILVLVKGHGEMIKALKSANDVAHDGDDYATVSLLVARLYAHEGHHALLNSISANQP